MTAHADPAHTLDVINKLYAAEKRSLLPRLAELAAFVDWADAREMEKVRRMIADETRHQIWLAEAADRCRGVLLCAPPDAGTANLHYCELRALLPLVIGNIGKLVDAYAGALQESAGLMPDAIETIARIHSRHLTHLEQLRNLQPRL